MYTATYLMDKKKRKYLCAYNVYFVKLLLCTSNIMLKDLSSEES